ncbi:hypothetical protein L1887_34921 [Cichorium endivia]|nr:hypothetical protein L1887_34921 [Cichorium endivia]
MSRRTPSHVIQPTSGEAAPSMAIVPITFQLWQKKQFGQRLRELRRRGIAGAPAMDWRSAQNVGLDTLLELCSVRRMDYPLDDMTNPIVLRFHLGGKQRYCIILDFALRLGLYHRVEIDAPEFPPFLTTCAVPCHLTSGPQNWRGHRGGCQGFRRAKPTWTHHGVLLAIGVLKMVATVSCCQRLTYLARSGLRKLALWEQGRDTN